MRNTLEILTDNHPQDYFKEDNDMNKYLSELEELSKEIDITVKKVQRRNTLLKRIKELQKEYDSLIPIDDSIAKELLERIVTQKLAEEQ